MGPRGGNPIAYGLDGVAWAYAALFLVVGFLALAVLANWITKRRGPQGPAEPWQRWQPGDRRPKRPTAHDLLRARRARGEMNVEDFEEMLAMLGPDPYADEPVGSAPGQDREHRDSHRP